MVNWRRAWGQSITKLIWCSGLPLMYVQLEEGWGQSVMKLMWCSGFPEIYVCLEGVGSVCHDDFSICALYYICNCFGVVVLQRSIVNWRRGGQSPCQLTIDACYTITPHQSHIYHNLHIPMADAPPTPQSTIDPCHTVTPHKSHILEHAHIPMTD